MGRAAAEINALRRVFGADADRVVITNTKGFTGHAMGAGIEDVVAVKALETGIVPPVPNYREPDPDLGDLNLSRGGAYPVRYALRLAAGFGSQVAWRCCAGRRWRTASTAPPTNSATRTASSMLPPGSDGSTCSVVTTARGLEIDHRRLRVRRRRRSRHVAARLGGAGAVRRPTGRVGAPGRSRPPRSARPARTSAAEPVWRRRPRPPLLRQLPSLLRPSLRVDDVLAQVTAVVAEMTGYPTDLLEPDLDLEADLGVDTVKQAEVFAAVRTQYELERDDNLQLRDSRRCVMLPTGSADAPVSTRRHRSQPAPAPVPLQLGGAAEPGVDDVLAQVTAVVAEMTGYPTDLLEPGSGSGGGSGCGHGEAGRGVRCGADALRHRAG